MSWIFKFFIVTLISWSFALPSYAQKLWQKDIQIYFAPDEYILGQDFKEHIRRNILDVGTQNIREIRISGNADKDASDTYNINLSDRRAKNTAAFLLTQGVKQSMISMDAFGESKPISEEKKFNRRVDIALFFERNFSVAQINRKKVIQGYVYDAKTSEKISADFLTENGKNQMSSKTSEKGFFRLKCVGSENMYLTFIHAGFLNAHLTLSADDIAGSAGDTIFLEVQLNPVEVVEKITLKNIYFYTDTHILKPSSYPDLENLLKTLRTKTDMLIEIQGHMNFPSNLDATIVQKEYNLHLSHRRAKAIYEYLLSNGIDKKRVSYRGMSNFKMLYPVPKNETQGDMNKRVEIWSLKIIS